MMHINADDSNHNNIILPKEKNQKHFYDYKYKCTFLIFQSTFEGCRFCTVTLNKLLASIHIYYNIYYTYIHSYIHLCQGLANNFFAPHFPVAAYENVLF